MKKLLSPLIAVALLLNGCASLQSFFGGLNPAYKQAFGDAIRSLEGVAVENLPAQIIALRKQWLPPGKIYDDLAAGVIHSYVAAHPNTPDQVKKVLESLATLLQTTP